MHDPWASWNAMVRAGTMIGETLDASRRVVNVRNGTISAALANPLGADHKELALMVDEKATAFAAAGAAWTQSWWAMQADVTAEVMAMGGMMMWGKLPNALASRAMAARRTRIGDAALRGSVDALRPIHATATANARRLKNVR